MDITVDHLKEEFLLNGEVEFSLSRKESACLGSLIEAWYCISRYKSKPFFISWFYRLTDKLRWVILMRRSFYLYKQANEAFIFYILFKGKDQLYIQGENVEGENIKNIKIISKAKQGV